MAGAGEGAGGVGEPTGGVGFGGEQQGNPMDQQAPPDQPPGRSPNARDPAMGDVDPDPGEGLPVGQDLGNKIERGVIRGATNLAMNAFGPFGNLARGLPGIAGMARGMGATGPATGPSPGSGGFGPGDVARDPRDAVAAFQANLRRRRV